MERAIPHLPGDDLTVAKDFYIDQLGFTLRFEATEDGRTGLVGVERGGMCLTIDCPMPGHGRDVCVLGQKFADAARATLAVYEGLPPGAVPLTASGVQTGHGIRAPLPGSTDIASRPIIRSTACVCEREDDDVLGCDLVRNRERKAIEDGHPPVWPIVPLRRRVGELKDQRERCLDLILQLGPETSLARFVVVHLPIDLGNREPVESEIH